MIKGYPRRSANDRVAVKHSMTFVVIALLKRVGTAEARDVSVGVRSKGTHRHLRTVLLNINV